MTKKTAKPSTPDKNKKNSKEVKSTKPINKTKEVKKEVKEVPKKISQTETKKPTLEKKVKESKAGGKVGGFKAGDHAFYPSHGVGKIVQIDNIEIDGHKLDILIMFFEKEKLTIKIPASQIAKTGLRPLISRSEMNAVFDILKSGVKKLKGMWSRRAQEYEAKINSGNIVLLAEVLRDLTRDIEDGDRSYSERIIYETAINRLSLEYSVIENISFEEAKEKIISTAKHKLSTSDEVKAPKHDIDDDFDLDEESEEEEDEDGDGDDDDDDDKPKKRGRKKKD
ncbi:MAG: CarD-like/TRCF domain protein [Rickettsiaceae bacterium]|nr:CarD-like/TRCF domain protein [Rickettsiaceae bacterium]